MGSLTSRDDSYKDCCCEICLSYDRCHYISRKQIRQPHGRTLDGRREKVPISIWLCVDCIKRDYELESRKK